MQERHQQHAARELALQGKIEKEALRAKGFTERDISREEIKLEVMKEYES